MKRSVAILCPLLWLLPMAQPSPGSLDREVLAMGTRLGLHLEGDSPAALALASEAALAEVARIEAACSTWRGDSSWSRLNQARGEAVPLDREWIDLLGRVQTWSRETGGAFDPVLMALLRAWGIREGGRTPSWDQLAWARSASGCALLQLDGRAGTARLTHPEAGVEEGAFLKGYALDRARARASAFGVRAGLLDFGGQLFAWGKVQSATIADPGDRRSPRIGLLLKEASLSTSGCSERGRHILDPGLGEPSPDWGSVSVVARDGLTADVLSTALYVMGPDRGLAWASDRGVAAVFLPHNGKVRMSPAFLALHPKEF